MVDGNYKCWHHHCPKNFRMKCLVFHPLTITTLDMPYFKKIHELQKEIEVICLQQFGVASTMNSYTSKFKKSQYAKVLCWDSLDAQVMCILIGTSLDDIFSIASLASGSISTPIHSLDFYLSLISWLTKKISFSTPKSTIVGANSGLPLLSKDFC